MEKASGIGFDLDSEKDGHLVLCDPHHLDGALPELAPVETTPAGSFGRRSDGARGKEEFVGVRDAALDVYDLRMAELDASCDDDCA